MNDSAIAGSGAIACGLAASAARHGEVLLWARSDGSAQRRARQRGARSAGALSGEVNAGHVRVVTDLAALGEATAVVEAVAEDQDVKCRVLAEPRRASPADDALLATTTSSLSVERLAQASRRAGALRRPARLQPGARR